MALVFLPKLRLNCEISGPMDAPAIVLLHALGTSMGIWDDLMPHLARWRVLRLDLRGHGASDVPAPPYNLGAMVHDVEDAMVHFGLRDAVVIGVSLGGLIAQGLAIKRLDLVHALVLSNTAAKIGGPSLWQARIETVSGSGLEPYSPSALERMLGPRWQNAPQMPRLRDMLLNTPLQGWIGAAHAVAGADFYTPISALHLPVLVIAGTRDGSTPPDLVRETADIIPNSEFHLMQGIGHLPMLENARAFADLVLPFLARIGHG
jgi:3-oxoadipate enol-lactonase